MIGDKEYINQWDKGVLYPGSNSTRQNVVSVELCSD